MNFSQQNLVSINEIKADVLVTLNDEEEKLFTSGWYVSQIQQALQELSFDTFFLSLYKDFDFPTETLAIEMPKGAFNIKKVYVYNGDNCSVSTSQNVWFKSGYITQGAGKGYTARNKANDSDPFIKSVVSEGILYCNLQNGWLMFSSSCSSYNRVRIEYNGIQTNIGETPFIPIQFREAVKMFVEEKAFKALTTRNRNYYRPLWTDTHQLLYAPYTGVWDKAKYRAKIMDTKEREDLMEYLSRMNY